MGLATDGLSLFSMLKTRMHWHEERQKLLAENVSNASTPGYYSRDLKMPDFSQMMSKGGIGPARTDANHMALGLSDQGTFRNVNAAGSSVTPSKNAVNLEDEMMKVAQNQLDYQTVSNLYQSALGLIRTSIGRK